MNKDFDKIDQIAQEAFDEFQVDFNPEHWELMEEKLDKKEHLMPYIWLYKGIEAGLLLLIFFTLGHFYFMQTDPEFTAAHKNGNTVINPLVTEQTTAKESISGLLNQPAQTEESSILHIEAGNDENVVIANQKDDRSTSSFNSTNHSKGIASTIPNEKENSLTNNNNQHLDQASLAQLENNDAGGNSVGNANLLSDNARPNEHLTVTADFKESLDKEESLLEVDNNIEAHHQSDYRHHSVSALTLEDYQIDNNGGKEEGDEFVIKNEFVFPKIYKCKRRVAVLFGTDMNSESSEGLSKLGMKFGANIEHELNKRFSISYGLAVSRKRYEANFTQEIDRTATEGVVYIQEVRKNTKLSTFELPVYLNFVLFQNAKWRFSASSGVAANFLATRYVSGETRTALNQSAGALVNVAEINPNNQEKGLFQGAALSGNFYPVLSASTELDRNLSDNLSLFLQVQYQHALMPVSTGRDYIHNFGLQAGIKTILH